MKNKSGIESHSTCSHFVFINGALGARVAHQLAYFPLPGFAALNSETQHRSLWDDSWKELSLIWLWFLKWPARAPQCSPWGRKCSFELVIEATEQSKSESESQAGLFINTNASYARISRLFKSDHQPLNSQSFPFHNSRSNGFELILIWFNYSQLITFKDGKIGVNFLGYHAEAGLGGLLTGDAAHGGLSASAGTPFGNEVNRC